MQRLFPKWEDIAYDLNMTMSIFRVISYIGSSFAYLISDYTGNSATKIIIILLLCSASVVIGKMHAENLGKVRDSQALVVTEYIGLLLILMFTGGIESPFIWCILNPMIGSVQFFSHAFTVSLVVIYYIFSTFTTYKLFNEANKTLTAYFSDNAISLLSFILIAILINFLLTIHNRVKELNEKLLNQYQELKETNEEVNSTLEEMMILDLIMENALTESDFKILTKEWMNLLLKWTNAEYVAYYPEIEALSIPSILVAKEQSENKEDTSKRILKATVPYNIIPTACIHVALNRDISKKQEELYQKKVNFISKLLTIQFNRVSYYQTTNHQHIVQEKNRIADELHDKVSQRLFSVSCGLYALKNDYLSNEETLSERYDSVVDIIGETVKELRESIYGLSTKKQGVNSFESWLSSYTENVRNVHGVIIDYRVDVDEVYLSTDVQKSLYRICSEAISNSIKHGNSTAIDINIEKWGNHSEIQIADNGFGFDYDNLKRSDYSGIGLKNMDAMVKLLNGEFEIESKIGVGTKIRVLLPLLEGGHEINDIR